MDVGIVPETLNSDVMAAQNCELAFAVADWQVGLAAWNCELAFAVANWQVGLAAQNCELAFAGVINLQVAQAALNRALNYMVDVDNNNSFDCAPMTALDLCLACTQTANDAVAGAALLEVAVDYV